ncbi:MAG: hypothetical protein ACJA06_001504 [Halocynthiibacter sp.]|jgi:hypothetical protein
MAAFCLRDITGALGISGKAEGKLSRPGASEGRADKSVSPIGGVLANMAKED